MAPRSEPQFSMYSTSIEEVQEVIGRAGAVSDPVELIQLYHRTCEISSRIEREGERFFSMNAAEFGLIYSVDSKEWAKVAGLIAGKIYRVCGV